MDMKEKLVELLKQTEINKINGHTALAETCFTPNVFENMATNLIANGVTVQEWISVKDRLPEPFVDVIAFFGGQEMNVDCVDNNGRWYSSYMDRDDPTYWMPLPQPPKGE